MHFDGEAPVVPIGVTIAVNNYKYTNTFNNATPLKQVKVNKQKYKMYLHTCPFNILTDHWSASAVFIAQPVDCVSGEDRVMVS